MYTLLVQTMKMNLVIDESLMEIAKQKAKLMGVGLSAYVRLLLSKDTEDFRNNIDKMVLESKADDCEKISYKDFYSMLEGMKNSYVKDKYNIEV